MKFKRYKIVAEPWVDRALLQIPEPFQQRLRDAIDELAEDPFPADSEEMHGKATGLRRLRVGKLYRVVYQIVEERLIILVVRAGHRSKVYSGLERFSRGR